MRKMATESGRGHRIPERAGATVDCDLPDMGQELSSGLNCHLISLLPMLLFRKENNNNNNKKKHIRVQFSFLKISSKKRF